MVNAAGWGEPLGQVGDSRKKDEGGKVKEPKADLHSAVPEYTVSL